tara:strand:+ start:911 stop:1399 length:489 start_codon:yes stop_codon:yes gene_type:complete
MAQDASFSDGTDSALNLGALTPEDLEVMSSILQDGIFFIKDLAWSNKKRQVAILVNRFRWENKSEYMVKKTLPERVNSLLIIDNVLNVSSQGIDRSDINAPLNLLKLDLKQSRNSLFLTLLLSDFGAIRCEVEAIQLCMKDVTQPHKAKSGKIPNHPMNDES